MSAGKKISSFKKRIINLVLTIVISVSAVVITLSVGTSAYSLMTKSVQLAANQGEIITESINQSLNSIYQVGKLTRDNSIIYKDIRYKSDEITNYMVFTNDVYKTLLTFKKVNQMIDFIAVLKYTDQSVKYVGYQWRADKASLYNDFMSNYKSASDSLYEDMKINLAKGNFQKDIYTLNIYIPVYDSDNPYKEIGLVCIGIKEKDITQYFNTLFVSNFFVIDDNHMIIADKNQNNVGTEYNTQKKYEEESNVTYENNKFIIYNHIDTSKWIIQLEIPLLTMIKDSIMLILCMIVLVIMMCVIAVFLCIKMLKTYYKPLDDIKKRMVSVSAGNMAIRMNVEYKEEEFNAMANCFNYMVQNIEQLLERIRDEQNQMKQIELNALQSQIKPHFLYNTLECIHMQALMDGNKEVSKLVKALATFYRMCLSKGQDLVTLKQELEHIDSYLIIQNIRYSNIIKIIKDIPEQYLELSIPKMTLQPLIENCIYHGIKVKEGFQGTISISAYEKGKNIIIEIADNGVGMTEEQLLQINSTLSEFDMKYGYGVRNVHKRISILFGNEYGLHYRINENNGITVEICLPKHNEEVMVCTK